MDFEDRRLRSRPADEAAGAPAPLDQPGSWRAATAPCSRSCASIVFGRKLVLERDAVAGRPFARHDAARMMSARMRWCSDGGCCRCPSLSASIVASLRQSTQRDHGRSESLRNGVAADDGGRPRPACARATQTQSTLRAIGKDPGVEDGVARLAGKRRMRSSSDTKSAAPPAAMPAGPAPKRLRCRRQVPRRTARGRSSRRRCASTLRCAVRQALRIFELPQLVGDADQHVGIRADAEAAASLQESGARGNVPSPRLASVIGQSPATAPLAAMRVGLGARSCGWRG